MRFFKAFLTDSTFDGSVYQCWFIDLTAFVAIMGLNDFNSKKILVIFKWITKLIINDKPKRHMLSITYITGARYYSKKCSYGTAVAPAQQTWFSVLKFVTTWGLKLTNWLKEQALMCWIKQPKRLVIYPKKCAVI